MIRSRKYHQIGAVDSGDGFSKTAGRQEKLLAERAHRIDQKNIDVAREPKVLETIVEDEDANVARLQAASLRKAVFADAKQHAALQSVLHQLDFIAGANGAAIAATENGNALTFGKEFFREPNHHGRLAGTTHGDVAHTDDYAIQALLPEPSVCIEPGAELHRRTIKQRERPEQRTEQRRKIHRDAPSRYLAISARARAVAPRLSSTRRLALSPI